MCKEIEADKFICNGCSRVIKVNTFEDIIKFEKRKYARDIRIYR